MYNIVSSDSCSDWLVTNGCSLGLMLPWPVKRCKVCITAYHFHHFKPVVWPFIVLTSGAGRMQTNRRHFPLVAALSAATCAALMPCTYFVSTLLHDSSFPCCPSQIVQIVHSALDTCGEPSSFHNYIGWSRELIVSKSLNFIYHRLQLISFSKESSKLQDAEKSESAPETDACTRSPRTLFLVCSGECLLYKAEIAFDKDIA